MKKLAKVLFYIEGIPESKTYEYQEHCSIYHENGIVYVKTDDNLQLAVNAGYFISLEKVEK